jgi:hypothetical protein
VGVSTQYIVRVSDATDVAVYAQNIEISGRHEQLASGSGVRLTWKPEHTFVIQRRGGSEEIAEGGVVDA